MRTRRRRGDAGVTAVLIAFMMTVIVGCLAFVTDFGMAYVNKRGLQNGADAAALAVAEEIAVKAIPTATCAQLVATWSGPGLTMAHSYFAKNKPAAAATISSFSVTCSAGGTMLVVSVATAQHSPTFFGGLLGHDEIALAQAARAVVAPAKTVIGLRPFGICAGGAQAIIANPAVNYTMRLDNTDLGCGSASGNWGVLDFNGGANGTPEIADWILNGYNGPIGVAPPVLIPGNPGAPSPGALEAEMNSVLDDEIVIPVYDLLSGNGSNAVFRVTGFLSTRICAWKFNNKNGQGTCYDALVVPSPVPQHYLQLRYNGYVPLGDISTLCTIGNVTCDLGTRLYKLAD